MLPIPLHPGEIAITIAFEVPDKDAGRPVDFYDVVEAETRHGVAVVIGVVMNGIAMAPVDAAA